MINSINLHHITGIAITSKRLHYAVDRTDAFRLYDIVLTDDKGSQFTVSVFPGGDVCIPVVVHESVPQIDVQGVEA